MTDDDGVLVTRTMPEITEATLFFWTAGAQGQLEMLGCDTCGFLIHPPVSICPSCFSRETSPKSMSGQATLFAYTINRHRWEGGMPTPYVIGIVELAEQPGLHLTTNIVECDEANLAIGMPLEVTFLDYGEIFIPVFRPATST